MKLFSKMLIIGLIFGGVIIGSNTLVSASGRVPIGHNAGQKYSNRKDSTDLSYSQRRVRNALDSYVANFDFRNSHAAVLFPNNKYTHKDLVRIIKNVFNTAGLAVPNRDIFRRKSSCYKLINDNIKLFDEYVHYSHIEQGYELASDRNHSYVLDREQRYELATAMAEHLNKPAPENEFEDVDSLVVSEFLVKNDSYRYLTDQHAYDFKWDTTHPTPSPEEMYCVGFDYTKSNAFKLFPDNVYPLKRLQQIAQDIARIHEVPQHHFIITNEACCYRFIEYYYETARSRYADKYELKLNRASLQCY